MTFNLNLLFLNIFICEHNKMGRKKQETTKETRMQFRIEKELKNEYILICKKHKIVYSEQVRNFIFNDLKRLKNG